MAFASLFHHELEPCKPDGRVHDVHLEAEARSEGDEALALLSSPIALAVGSRVLQRALTSRDYSPPYEPESSETRLERSLAATFVAAGDGSLLAWVVDTGDNAPVAGAIVTVFELEMAKAAAQRRGRGGRRTTDEQVAVLTYRAQRVPTLVASVEGAGVAGSELLLHDNVPRPYVDAPPPALRLVSDRAVYALRRTSTSRAGCDRSRRRGGCALPVGESIEQVQWHHGGETTVVEPRSTRTAASTRSPPPTRATGTM